MIISAFILYNFIMVFYQRSGPGPLGPVRRILVVRSGQEGPQFTRSVVTLRPNFVFQYCQLAQNQPKSQFLFHKNCSPRDFIMYNDFAFDI
jgi:hypothetical protein